jgi:hypothetical protein
MRCGRATTETRPPSASTSASNATFSSGVHLRRRSTRAMNSTSPTRASLWTYRRRLQRSLKLVVSGAPGIRSRPSAYVVPTIVGSRVAPWRVRCAPLSLRGPQGPKQSPAWRADGRSSRRRLLRPSGPRNDRGTTFRASVIRVLVPHTYKMLALPLWEGSFGRAYAPTDDSGGATSSSARRSAFTPSQASTSPATTISPPPSR